MEHSDKEVAHGNLVIPRDSVVPNNDKPVCTTNTDDADSVDHMSNHLETNIPEIVEEGFFERKIFIEKSSKTTTIYKEQITHGCSISSITHASSDIVSSQNRGKQKKGKNRKQKTSKDVTKSANNSRQTTVMHVNEDIDNKDPKEVLVMLSTNNTLLWYKDAEHCKQDRARDLRSAHWCCHSMTPPLWLDGCTTWYATGCRIVWACGGSLRNAHKVAYIDFKSRRIIDLPDLPVNSRQPGIIVSDNYLYLVDSKYVFRIAFPVHNKDTRWEKLLEFDIAYKPRVLMTYESIDDLVDGGIIGPMIAEDEENFYTFGGYTTLLNEEVKTVRRISKSSFEVSALPDLPESVSIGQGSCLRQEDTFQITTGAITMTYDTKSKSWTQIQNSDPQRTDYTSVVSYNNDMLRMCDHVNRGCKLKCINKGNEYFIEVEKIMRHDYVFTIKM